MGSKGSNTTTTNQQSTYQPNPQAAGYIQNALQQGQNAAATPFQTPVAPVAGLSPDQLKAFGSVNSAQGMAQPYIDQAQQYFSPQGVQSFLNPYASNVMAGMKDVFGQQEAQTTGQLTQAAGGVGADRIAVGQSELAKQQDLAAGQTLSGLYSNAAQQAQSAGYGTAALGSQAQNAALSGAQAQLATGGLQQQLRQAQLNAPYQNDLARLAYPFQTAQFLSGITGALAPGLGGTTSGQGNTRTPGPSLLSQILGLGTAGVGAAGGAGAFNPTSGSNPKGSSPSYGGGNMFSGDAYGGSGSNPLPGLSASDYGSGYARGGAASPYDIEMTKGPDGSFGYDEGGSVANPYELPPGFNDKPINIDQQSIVPTGQIHAIQPQIPSLNLNPPQQSGGGGGSGDASKAIGTAMQMAMMFMNKGGRVDPKKFDGANPYAFAEGGATFDDRWNGSGDDDVVNPGDPIRMPDDAAVDEWRKGADTAMSFSGKARPMVFPPRAADDSAASPAPRGGRESANTYSAKASAADDVSDRPTRDAGFAGSPWAALTAAGLGMAAGTSPFALTNIAQGGMQGLKTLEQQRTASQKDETIDQSAKRLAQEAKFHEDQYSKMTPYQKGQLELHQNAAEYTQMQPVKIGMDQLGRDIYGRKDPKTGQYINALTGKPVEDSALQVPPNYHVLGSPSASVENDPEALPPHARFVQGVNAPEGVRPEVLAQLPPERAATIRAIDEGRQSLTSIPMKLRAAVIDQLNAYDPQFDQTTWATRSAQQRDLSTNGNAGKMILAVNQLLPHLKTASDKAQELENSAYPAANTIKNWWATATGDPRVGKFETVREVAAMDAARLLRGSGAMAEQDIDFWRKNLAAAGSPAQLQEKLKLLADDLMGARISSIQHSYRTNMRMEPPDFVSKEAKEALEAIKARNGGPSQAPAPAPSVAAPASTPAAQAPAAKPPTVTQNGHVYTLQPDGSYK